jgi:membrane fusion protein (multidrug efflux system)
MKQIALFITLSFLMACSPGGSDDKKAELEGENTNPADLNTLPVEIKKVAPEVFTRHFEVSGFMEAVKDAVLSPEINGQIQQVIVQRGARVKKGDLLIKLNTDLTEKNIEEVNISLSLASQIFEKQEDLWAQKIGSELQYLEAKNAVESLEARLATLQKQLEMAHITAPFSGIVDDIMVKEGELAAPGMQLLHLLDLSEMRVSSRVSEAYLNSVHKGDMVEIRVDTYKDS